MRGPRKTVSERTCRTFARIAAAALPIVVTSLGIAKADTVTFNNLAAPGTGSRTPLSPVSASGFNFEALPMRRVLLWNMADAHNADPGGATLGNSSNSDTIVMTKMDGGLFSVQSIDVADLINQVFLPCCAVPPVIAAVDFIGTFADSTTVTSMFITDNLPGLQTFNLSGFTGLLSLSWTPRGQLDVYYPFAQVDNIVVTTTTVPGPMPIFGVASAFYASRKLRKRIRKSMP